MSELTLHPNDPTHNPYDTSEYVGKFSEPAYGDILISAVQDRLVVDYYGHKAPLVQQANDIFMFTLPSPDVTESQVTVIFKRKHGRVSAADITLEPTVDVIRFERNDNVNSIN